MQTPGDKTPLLPLAVSVSDADGGYLDGLSVDPSGIITIGEKLAEFALDLTGTGNLPAPVGVESLDWPSFAGMETQDAPRDPDLPAAPGQSFEDIVGSGSIDFTASIASASSATSPGDLPVAPTIGAPSDSGDPDVPPDFSTAGEGPAGGDPDFASTFATGALAGGDDGGDGPDWSGIIQHYDLV